MERPWREGVAALMEKFRLQAEHGLWICRVRVALYHMEEFVSEAFGTT